MKRLDPLVLGTERLRRIVVHLKLPARRMLLEMKAETPDALVDLVIFIL